MRRSAKVTPKEWQLMRELWDEAPLTITQLTQRLRQQTGWSKNTVITMLNHLEAKGVVRFEQQAGERARRYFPAVAEKTVAAEETSDLLQRVYQGNFGLLLSTMLESQALSPQEIDELQALLRQED